MPLYEYQCDACGHRFEVIQKFSDPPLESCPKCGGAVHKLQSAPAFQLKGSGWYITDYAKKDQRAATGDDSKDDAVGRDEVRQRPRQTEARREKARPRRADKTDEAPRRPSSDERADEERAQPGFGSTKPTS